MSYRPQVKADSNGTTQDLPIDAETVQGKTPVFTTTNQTISGVKTYTDTQTFKGGLTLYAESGDSPRLTFQRGELTDTYNDWSLYDSGGFFYLQQRGSGSTAWETRATFTQNDVNFAGTIKEDGTPLVDKYAHIGHSHESIIDYGDTTNTIKIGYRGNGLTASQIAYIAGYSVDDPNNPNEHKIKDISKDVLKSWLGYAEVSSGIISPGGTLSATSGYVWIIFPHDTSANTFTFSYGSGNRTAYGFAIVQGGGCIRYFQSATQLTRYSVSTITFSNLMVYIKFKI